MGHGHALSAAAIQSRCQEVASCWRLEKSKSKMRTRGKKEKKEKKVATCHPAVTKCGKNIPTLLG